MYIIPLLFIASLSAEYMCTYGGEQYSCGSKGPNGQYCNFLICENGASGCCSVMWCSQFLACTCGNDFPSSHSCTNKLVVQNITIKTPVYGTFV